ncbi:MAG: hypothetical protein HOI70_02545 [Opitutae bacterium]|nr:hypothetical protein [Opitutae bacterium]
MISQTYDGLLKQETDEGGFYYEVRLAKECAKVLGQPWTEVKKDLAIYRIFKQLQAHQFLVEHEHYSKIRMVFEASSIFKEYFGLDSDTFEFSSQGLEKFNELFIQEGCAVGNPQDFSKLKFIYKNSGAGDVDLVRTSPDLLLDVYKRSRQGLQANACLNSLQGALKSLNAIKPKDVQGNEQEKDVLNQIKDVTERFLKLNSGICELDGSDEIEIHALEEDEEQEICYLEIDDVLTQDDAVDDRYDEAFFYKDYSIDTSSLNPNQTFQVDLISDDFDAFLYVFERNASDHFLQDDNSGEGLNARLLVENDTEVQYRLRVSSAEAEETGRFKLFVQTEPPA